MSHITTLLRGIAVAAVAGSVLPMVGGAADAATSVTCTFEDATGIVRIDVKGFESSVVLSSSMDERLLVNSDLCTAADGTIADFFNISRVVVRGGSSEQAAVIDLGGGNFGPGRGEEPGGSDEIEFDIALGEGSDYLEIRAYGGGSTVRAGTKEGEHLLNLNATEKLGVDADASVRAVEMVAFEGGSGDDRFLGTGGRGTGDAFRGRLTLSDFVGGDDRFTGGSAGDTIYDSIGNDTDRLRGGAGRDNLSSYDQDVAKDVIDGQGGTDTCQYDATDLVSSCEDLPDN